jgi:hypothetical protein
MFYELICTDYVNTTIHYTLLLRDNFDMFKFSYDVFVVMISVMMTYYWAFF